MWAFMVAWMCTLLGLTEKGCNLYAKNNTNHRVQNNFFQTCSNLPAVYKNQLEISTGYFVEIDWKYWRKTAFNGRNITSCRLCTAGHYF